MKIFRILIIFLFLTIILSQDIFASSIITTGKDWITDGQDNANKTFDSTEVQEVSGQLYSILVAAAVAVAIIVGAIMGIQFMTAGIDTKVQVKQALFPYLISCIVAFGAFGIWKLFVTIMNGVA